MPDQREVIESPLDQGAHEAIAYLFTFSASAVTTIVGNPTFAVIRADGLDVTTICMPSGAIGTAAGLVATSPIVTALDADRWYRLYCRVVHDGTQVSELFCTLRGRP
jgi:hypothetical protein